MADKQIKIDIKDSINKIKNIEKMYFSLLDKYKTKEQECEALKNRSDEWISRYEQEAKLREFLNERLDQLKAEKEIWKNQVLTIDDEAVTVKITQQQFEEYNQLKQKEREGKL